jgi:hypothetical protein
MTHAMAARSCASLLLALAALLAACASSGTAPAADQHPTWLKALIVALERRPPGHPPWVVSRYRYQGQVVYHLPPPCCDAPGALYDAAGRYLCAPDGGFLGIGEGRCRDFQTRRTDGQLVWHDSR